MILHLAIAALLQFAPTDINVRDLGAVGDGKADDTAAFQRAADRMRDVALADARFFGRRFGSNVGRATEGPRPRIVVPAGTYRLTSAVLFHRDIFVTGLGEVEIVQENPAEDAFYCCGVLRMRLENLRFRGGRVQVNAATMNVESSNVRVIGCAFVGAAETGFQSLSFGVKEEGRRYLRPVGEWKYDRGKRAYARDERYGTPSVRENYHSTLIVIEDSRFEGCPKAIDMHPDGSVVRNCRFVGKPGADGGLIRRGNVINAYGLEARLYDGQSLFGPSRRTSIWLSDSTVRSADGSGAVVVRGTPWPANQAASVVLQNVTTDTGVRPGRSLMEFTDSSCPNIVALLDVRADGKHDVAAFAFDRELTEGMLEANRRNKQWEVERQYVFGLRGCSPNVRPPDGIAAKFLRPVPADAGRGLMRHPLLGLARPQPTATLLASDFGIGATAAGDETEALRSFVRALKDRPGALGILPGRWMRIADTIELDGDIALAGAGVTALEGVPGGRPCFRVLPGAKVTLRNLQVRGAGSMVQVGRDASVRVDSCFSYDSENAAVRTERGSRTLVDGGVYYAARLYEGEGDAFLSALWYRFTATVPPDAPLCGSAAIVNRGRLEVWDILGVPCVFDRFDKDFAKDEPKATYEHRWVDNYGVYRSRMMRYGGEWGGITPIFHFGKAKTAMEGSYAWYWNRSVISTPVLGDSPDADIRCFNVSVSAYRQFVPEIEMLWRKPGEGEPLKVPHPRLDFIHPTYKGD